MSRALGFPWWDKPAQPCLASRFPYGESISAERLKRVGQAEAWLITRGFNTVRVRSHGLAARIEVPSDQIRAVLTLAESEPLVEAFRALGFPWWDKPAQPCLASRFPYGESISAERLKRVGQAEAWLITRGFSTCLLYTSPSPRDGLLSRMPSSA